MNRILQWIFPPAPSRPPFDFRLPAADGSAVSFDADFRRDQRTVLLFYRGHWCPFCRRQLRGYQRILSELERQGAKLLALSADPLEASLRSSQALGLGYPLLSDERHVVADAHGIPISYRSPRAQVYPHGFHQPAVLVYAGEERIFGWVQRPSFFNMDGALWRPSPARVLAIARRAARRANA